MSQANLPGKFYPLVTGLAADGIPVAVTCRVLKLSHQPYYRWLAAPDHRRRGVEAYRANALFDVHRDDPEFGHRLLADEGKLHLCAIKDVCSGKDRRIPNRLQDEVAPSREHATQRRRDPRERRRRAFQGVARVAGLVNTGDTYTLNRNSTTLRHG